MKTVLTLFGLVLTLIFLLGADIRREKEAVPPPEPPALPCYGYTIIEFGKGIDCHGDTVRLVRMEGGGQRLIVQR